MHATQRHHKFSNTKLHRKLYSDYINHPDNIQKVCPNCHIGEAEGLIRWDEMQFCENFRILPRTKTGILTYARKNNWKEFYGS